MSIPIWKAPEQKTQNKQAKKKPKNPKTKLLFIVMVEARILVWTVIPWRPPEPTLKSPLNVAKIISYFCQREAHKIPKGRQNALTYISYSTYCWLIVHQLERNCPACPDYRLEKAGGLEAFWSAHSSAASAKNKRWLHQCFCMSNAWLGGIQRPKHNCLQLSWSNLPFIAPIFFF